MKFSIFTLLSAFTIVPVLGVAIIFPDLIWLMIFGTAFRLALCFGAVAAAVFQNRSRYFWIGFVAAGLVFNYTAYGPYWITLLLRMNTLGSMDFNGSWRLNIVAQLFGIGVAIAGGFFGRKLYDLRANPGIEPS